jgi:hypothetical protein
MLHDLTGYLVNQVALHLFDLFLQAFGENVLLIDFPMLGLLLLYLLSDEIDLVVVRCIDLARLIEKEGCLHVLFIEGEDVVGDFLLVWR